MRALAAAFLFVSGLACSGDDLILPEATPAAITPVNGEDQNGAVGAELREALVVRVDDADGDPVAGVRVAFILGEGADGGNTNPDTATTDGDGEASAAWVLGGSEGEQAVVAEVVGTDLSATFFAQAQRTSALTLELADGDGQGGAPGETLPDPIVVRLVDESGDGVAGRAVTWVVTTGGGSVSPQSSETDAAGLASTEWTLGPAAGTNEVSAVVSGVGVVSFTATAEDGGGGQPSASRSTIDASPSSIQAVSGTSTITVTVRDGQGEPVAGATVTLEATGAGNVLTQPAGPTGGDGVATGTLESLIPGTKVVSAIVNGSVRLDETVDVEVTASLTPVRLEFVVQPSDTEENERINPAVEVAVVGALGNIVPLDGVEIELELLEDDGDVSDDLEGDTSRETQDGVATFDRLEVDRDDQNYRLRATAPDRPDLEPAISQTFDIED
jgi:Invasin, domain 3